MTFVTSKQVAPRGEVLGDVVFDKLVDSSNGRLGSPALIFTFGLDDTEDSGFCVYPLLDGGYDLSSSVVNEFVDSVSASPETVKGSDGSFSATYRLTFKKTLKELYSSDKQFNIYLGYAFNSNMIENQFIDASTGVFYYPFNSITNAASTSVGVQVPWFPLVSPTSVMSGVSSGSEEGLVS